MIAILQRVVEDSSHVLVTTRIKAEVRRTNLPLREEQDAAYRAALEADQAREQQRQEEEERLESASFIRFIQLLSAHHLSRRCREGAAEINLFFSPYNICEREIISHFEKEITCVVG